MPDQSKQPTLLLLSSQITFVEHQQQSFSQSREAVNNIQFAPAQVSVNDDDHQISPARPAARLLFASGTIASRLKNSRRVNQLNSALQALQPQAVAATLAGGAHGGADIANDVPEKGPDQGRLPTGSAAEHHNNEVSSFQLSRHPFAFLEKRRALDQLVEIGKPFALEATYTWKSEADFERFMRFAQRYADANGMGYSQNSGENEASEDGSEG